MAWKEKTPQRHKKKKKHEEESLTSCRQAGTGTDNNDDEADNNDAVVVSAKCQKFFRADTLNFTTSLSLLAYWWMCVCMSIYLNEYKIEKKL